jgi:hypothetical protein
MAKKRRSMPRRESKSVFRRGTRVNPRNAPTMPMRGGIRM